VIVLDFELARLDWRITDLSKSFVQFAQTRFGFSTKKMKYFLEAYHASFPLDSVEISLIPAVWQFLTLRRIMVCWHRYCQTHSENWLKEAERKLNLAKWIDDNYDTLSCLIN
jgi:Ser/Thr protein kinase RdoA (MazF antagonist)